MQEVEVIKCTTAKEYIKVLSLSNDSWWDDSDRCSWIFRGQKSDIQLIPTLYRMNKQYPPKHIYQHLFNKTHNSLIYGISDLSSEIDIRLYDILPRLSGKQKENIANIIKAAFVEVNGIEKFLERCNRVLLQTPTLQLFKGQNSGMSAVDYFYKHLEELLCDFNLHCMSNSIGYSTLFNRDYHEAMALARHHTIPSRLLDWSEDPMIAGFFSVNNSSITDSVCVWALNKRYLRMDNNYGQIAFYDKLSRTGLEFLHLQKGQFTDMLGLDGYYYEHGNWPSLDQYLLKTFTNDKGTPYPQTYLKKIEIQLNSSEKINLLNRLDKMGINQYTLMPTYDNVAKSVHAT